MESLSEFRLGIFLVYYLCTVIFHHTKQAFSACFVYSLLLWHVCTARRTCFQSFNANSACWVTKLFLQNMIWLTKKPSTDSFLLARLVQHMQHSYATLTAALGIRHALLTVRCLMLEYSACCKPSCLEHTLLFSTGSLLAVNAKGTIFMFREQVASPVSV